METGPAKGCSDTLLRIDIGKQEDIKQKKKQWLLELVTEPSGKNIQYLKEVHLSGEYVKATYANLDEERF